MKSKKPTFMKMERYFKSMVQLRPQSAPIRMDFLSHRHTFWHCLAPLMLECRQRATFLPRAVVGVCTDAGYDSRAHEIAWLEEHGIPWLHLNDYNPEQEKADILCFTTPYPQSHDKRFNTTALASHNTRAVLIPYCTEWLGGRIFHHNYFLATLPFWRVFTASALSQMYYHQYQGMPLEYGPVTGNPEFDVCAWQSLPKYRHILDMAKGRKVVLWTPHYALQGPYLWSTWDTLSEKIIYLLSQHKDELFVVLRPHHFLRTELESWQPGQQPENAFQQAAQHMYEAGNFWLDATGQSIECVMACSALISDCSSMIGKALGLGKPVCYTPTDSGDGAAEIARLLQGVTSFARTTVDLHLFIQRLLDKTQAMPTPSQEMVHYLCGVADGQASARMADHLEQHFYPKATT